MMTIEKTPISFLCELCRKYHTNPPFFEFYRHEDANSTDSFECIAGAFDKCAKGTGYSKKKAKHDACSQLLKQLQDEEKFKAELLALPILSSSKVDCNSVIKLHKMCNDEHWPLPCYNLESTAGLTHSQRFTISCTLASRKCYGTCYSKKTAKQIAAKNLLDLLTLTNLMYDKRAVNEQLPEYAIQSFRNLKLNEEKKENMIVQIKNRHKYFQHFPKDIKNKVFDLLRSNNNDDKILNKVELVIAVCTALELNYNLAPTNDEKVKDYFIFELDCELDCVLIGKYENIFDDIIDYFKTMFNLRKRT